MNVAIDYLEVWQAPIGEQIRPRRFPVLTPHAKQRDAVVNFGALSKPSAALAAAPCLQPPQERGLELVEIVIRQPGLPFRPSRHLSSAYARWLLNRIKMYQRNLNPDSQAAGVPFVGQTTTELLASEC